MIEAKEAEQKMLESQLKDTTQEKDKKQEEVLRAREDVLSNFAELMETELQCSICSELFIKVSQSAYHKIFALPVFSKNQLKSHLMIKWRKLADNCQVDI